MSEVTFIVFQCYDSPTLFLVSFFSPIRSTKSLSVSDRHKTDTFDTLAGYRLCRQASTWMYTTRSLTCLIYSTNLLLALHLYKKTVGAHRVAVSYSATIHRIPGGPQWTVWKNRWLSWFSSRMLATSFESGLAWLFCFPLMMFCPFLHRTITDRF